MRGLSLLIATCCFAATQLSADTVYTYTATSVTMSDTPGIGVAITASVPGFFLSGCACGSGNPTVFQVGQQVPLNFSFLAAPAFAGATVNFGGFVESVNNVSGTANEVSTSASFVIPPNPNATYTFAAEATGTFTAHPTVCGPPTPLSCDTSANLLINNGGELTLRLFAEGPGAYTVAENFAGSPVPEPSSIALLLLGAVAFGGILFSRKRKSRCEDCPY